jgi:predicted nucleotidyltransferase
MLISLSPSRLTPATIWLPFADLKDALEKLFGRSVDLVEREAAETSRNFIRRRAILREAETVYG